MAAPADFVGAKVEEERLRDSLDRFIKERKKKKKKRDASPLCDKRERREKDAKKAKLHHQQHAAEHRSLQLHLLQPQNPKAHNFSAGKHVLNGHKHSQQHHHHKHRDHSLTNATKTHLQTAPRLPEQLRLKKRTVAPEAPALFTFTPLQAVKAKNQDLSEKHGDKSQKLNVKKENTEANVKHAEVKKNKGEFLFSSVCPRSRAKGIVHPKLAPFLLITMSTERW